MKRGVRFADGYEQLQRGRVDAARAVFESLPESDYRASFGLLVCDYKTNVR